MTNQFEAFQRALPVRVKVQKIITSRYPGGHRPSGWDQRHPGVEVVEVETGEEVALYSDGQQNTPQPGWELLLTEMRKSDEGVSFYWTLYGLTRESGKAA